MIQRFYLTTRDLHLYLGLFISPFLLVFAVSVFALVHAWTSPSSPAPVRRTVNNVPIPVTLAGLKGRDQVNAVRPVLDRLGVRGEIGFIRHISKEQRLVIPVLLPGHEAMVDLKLATASAEISERDTGLADAIVYLHKMPGPHNANVRGNTAYMSVWRWLTDVTAYSLLFLSVSGVYLWAVLRAERRIGLSLLAAGASSFLGIVYALSH